MSSYIPPHTYKQVMASPNHDEWSKAVNLELQAMERMGVWEEASEVLAGVPVLHTVWVFKKKFDANGNLVKYKASKLEENMYLHIPLGLSAPRANPCLLRSLVEGWECFVHVYMDDMVVISNDVARFKSLISDRFVMDDLGPINSLLGMKIKHCDNHLTLSQEKYISSILEEYNLSTCRSVPTPMIPNTCLVEATQQEKDEFSKLQVNYRRAIGLVNWAAVATRPDIGFAVSQLSQHLENPGRLHWKAFIHLLRYLSGTKHYALTVGGGDNSISIYVDADFASCVDTCCSYSGYLVRWGNSLISWRARKQATVSTSTTEAEYKALYDGVQEAIWLRALLGFLGIVDYPIPIYVNN
ncbi:hypothetical protein PSHT_00451 [Puccinia striiformis]|uniref:Reverse transcriptase Ty1/copia-type domain-containing protein n=1 Tax=Puccinia striiformis TaxID=27350 RepID=A0A2S4WN78_9BASI|nr:hypothetical protein PSHT_00451 [Puccinia striiformis]